MKEYDVIIIGSGGGSKLTRPCAELGIKVAIIDKGPIGGTCLNRGCIPSKMLIHPADIASHIREAPRFDIYASPQFDVGFSKLVKRVSDTVDAESRSSAPAYERHPYIDYYPHAANFLSNDTIEVNGEKITGKKIFLPVGARPNIPNIPGLKGTPFMTYIEALRNQKLPKKLLIIGAGYIAAELGYFYAGMGAEVQFLVRSQFLRREDEEIRMEFQRVFAAKYPVAFGAIPKKISYENDLFTVHTEDKAYEGDALLVATGVTPNTDTLSLENTDIALDSHGYIQVDDYLRTTVPHIYSYGDAIGRDLFRHTANFEGEYLFRTLYDNPSDEPIVYPPIPHAIFSNPQIGGVGKTEQQLREEGVDYVKSVNRYADSAMGMALLSETGFVKLLFERDSRRLVGAHIIGEEASNMIHMPIAYMNMGATVDDILNTIFVHPALPEVVRNAARKAFRN